jgi:hypothetical protein
VPQCCPDTPTRRPLCSVVYFTSRAIAGEDSLESLTSRAGSYAKRVRWVNANREAIVDAIVDAIVEALGAQRKALATAAA